MKKRLGIMLLTGVMAYSLALTGCSKETSEAVSTVQTEEGESVETTELTEESHNSSEQENITSAQSEEDVNQIAANEVAALIDAIYVQKRTADTDKQCAQAKAAWDALTEIQKELVEGENADPDYFGRDTAACVSAFATASLSALITFASEPTSPRRGCATFTFSN